MASGGESGYPSKRFLWQSRDRSLAKLRLSDNVRIVGGGEGGESRLESSGEIGGGGGGRSKTYAPSRRFVLLFNLSAKV